MAVVERRRSLAGLLVGLLGLGGLTFFLLTRPLRGGDVTLLVALVAFLAVGVLLLLKAPGNRLGWVLSLIGLALVAAAQAGALADAGWLVGDAVGGALWFGWFTLAGFLFLWYPSGAPPSRRWRVVEWAGYLSALIAFSYLFAGQVCLEATEAGCVFIAANPIGIRAIPNPEYGPLAGVNLVFQAAFLLTTITALVVRFVRGRNIERLQLKWLLFAALSLIATVMIQELFPALPDWADTSLFGLAVAAVPIAVGIAVLKYRLYDIERLISRTVGYALVAGLLALTYVGVAVWLPTIFIDQKSPIFVAGATLVTAALFSPLRRSILHSVDRRFHRSRYDSELVMAAFGSHLREQLDIERLLSEALKVVIRTMQPSSASVWMRQGSIVASSVASNRSVLTTSAARDGRAT